MIMSLKQSWLNKYLHFSGCFRESFNWNYPPDPKENRDCFLSCNVLEKQLVETISKRSILGLLAVYWKIQTAQGILSISQSISFSSFSNLPFNQFTTVQCSTCHSPFSTIITVSPVLVVRVDVVISVPIAGFLSSSGVELLRVFVAVVGLTSAIFPGSLQTKLFFEQSVEKVGELFQFIDVAA